MGRASQRTGHAAALLLGGLWLLALVLVSLCSVSLPGIARAAKSSDNGWGDQPSADVQRHEYELQRKGKVPAPRHATQESGTGDHGIGGGSIAESNTDANGDNPAPAPAEPTPEQLAAMRYNAQPPKTDAADSAKLLQGILARPEFQDKPVAAPQENWWTRFVDAVQKWLDGLGVPKGVANAPYTAIATVLIGILAALLIYLLVRWVWSFFAEGRPLKLKEDEQREEDFEPVALIKLAEAALARGDLREAIRLRFKAVLRRVPQPAAAVLLTNSQLKRRLSREYPAAARPFSQLVLCYEDVWYGGLAAQRDDYQNADSLARLVEAAIPDSSEEAKK